MLLDWSLVLCLSKSFFSLHSSNLCKINYRKLREDNREKRSILLETLIEVNEGNLCDTLKTTIPFGVAYHHSGLTGDGKYELICSFGPDRFHLRCHLSSSQHKKVKGCETNLVGLHRHRVIYGMFSNTFPISIAQII
jgi:hypothetical protein